MRIETAMTPAQFTAAWLATEGWRDESTLVPLVPQPGELDDASWQWLTTAGLPRRVPPLCCCAGVRTLEVRAGRNNRYVTIGQCDEGEFAVECAYGRVVHLHECGAITYVNDSVARFAEFLLILSVLMDRVPELSYLELALAAAEPRALRAGSYWPALLDDWFPLRDAGCRRVPRRSPATLAAQLRAVPAFAASPGLATLLRHVSPPG
jgi:hypothetical protein